MLIFWKSHIEADGMAYHNQQLTANNGRGYIGVCVLEAMWQKKPKHAHSVS